MATGNSTNTKLPSVSSDRTYQVSPTDLRSSHYAVIPPVGTNALRSFLDTSCIHWPVPVWTQYFFKILQDYAGQTSPISMVKMKQRILQGFDWFQPPQATDTTPLDFASVKLLPDIGEPHPFPYYVTAEVDLRPRPWAFTNISDEELFKMAASHFQNDERFAHDLLNVFLMELLGEGLAEECAREAIQLKT